MTNKAINTILNLLLCSLIIAILSGCNKDGNSNSLKCNDDDQPLTEINEIQIGNQIWMAENLTIFTKTGSWYYNNNCDFSLENGRLYLWETIMNGEEKSDAVPSGVQGLCPDGWHLPSAAEWEILCDHLSSNGLNANDLKKADSLLWPAPNIGTNSTKFNAVPTGTVFNNGDDFANIDLSALYLTSSFHNNLIAPIAFGIRSNSSAISKNIPVGPGNGWSVRCVKN